MLCMSKLNLGLTKIMHECCHIVYRLYLRTTATRLAGIYSAQICPSSRSLAFTNIHIPHLC